MPGEPMFSPEDLAILSTLLVLGAVVYYMLHTLNGAFIPLSSILP